MKIPSLNQMGLSLCFLGVLVSNLTSCSAPQTRPGQAHDRWPEPQVSARPVQRKNLQDIIMNRYQ